MERRRRRKPPTWLGCLPFVFIFSLAGIGGALTLANHPEVFATKTFASAKRAAVRAKKAAPDARPADLTISFWSNETSEPVSGAVVGIGGQYALSDTSGLASLGDLRTETGKLAARADGFEPLVEELSLRPGHNELSLWLSPAEETTAVARPAYLTIDDGPDPLWTPKVLDILKRERVPATFFLVGWRAEEQPDLVRRAYLDGHSIGNHSYSHDLTSLYTGSVRTYMDSLSENGEVLERLIGFRPALFRPPGGKAGNFRSGWSSLVRSAGYQTVLWNVSSGDGTATTPALMAQNVKKYLARLDEDDEPVILTHDVQSSIVKALPKIIAAVRRQGYEFTNFER